MNSLSWMLYLADVTGSLSTVLTLTAVLAGLAGLAAVIACAVKTDFDNIGAREPRAIWSAGWRAGKSFFPVAIAAALVASVIPSKTTIYAIAASQMGEKALNSATGGKAMQALNAWLDRQIAGDPPAKDDE